MQDLLHWLVGDVLKLFCAIRPLHITGVILFLLFLHLWNGISLIVHHDVCALFVFDQVSRILVDKTSLISFKFWLVWDMNDKSIPVFSVICHYMVLLYQSEWQYVGYIFRFLPKKHLVSRKVIIIVFYITPELQ